MAKVFQILVPDNSLVSRIIGCENQITELYVIDRADKKFVSDHSSELNKPALYILINRDKKMLYVGETDDSLKRLKNHESKDFWTEAIVFHSNTDSLSTTEVKWLEATTYKYLSELGYYDLSENKVKPQVPPLKKYQDILLQPYFEQVKEYTCAAGFDIFLRKADVEEVPHKDEVIDKPSIVQNNVWLLPSSKKRFDLEACFAEFGEVYWRISSNFKRIAKGDRGYVYSSDPDKAIIYRFDVVDSQISYSKVIDRDDKFSKKGSETNRKYGENGGLFVLIRLSGVVKDKRFALPILLKNGLNGAPQGAVRLSQDKYDNLLSFIDTNFDSEQMNVNNKKPRRAPFKFSMIGLKPGDIVTFVPSQMDVRVASDNTIEYDGELYTLSRFCKHFMPSEGSEFKEYQGPAHFSYKGKILDEIRKEKEKQ